MIAPHTSIHGTAVGILRRTVLLTISLGDVVHQLSELNEMAYQGCELLTWRANQMNTMAESDKVGYLFH